MTRPVVPPQEGRQVQLSKGHVATVDGWLPYVPPFYAHVTRTTVYGRRTIWIRGGKGEVIREALHWWVLGQYRCPRAPTGFDVDHINGDGLDNRITNLRVIPHADNVRIARRTRTNATGFRGVYRYRLKFVARIQVMDKIKHLGTFKTADAAAVAYDAAAIKLHGDFAQTNGAR